VPSTIPAVFAPWRPGDREIIRGYAHWPVTGYNLTQLTSAMNRVAEASVDAVVQIQAWIDEAESLQQDWADKVSDGTAHLGNVQSYKGPAPGATLTRDQQLKKADVLEWDTSLLSVEYQAGARSDSTAGGVLHARVAELKGKVLQAVGIEAARGAGGGTRLMRS
jgi:hypothetical protein